MSLYNGLIVKASVAPDLNVNWTEGYFTTPSDTLLGPVTYVAAGSLPMTPPAAGYEYVGILQIAGADQTAANAAGGGALAPGAANLGAASGYALLAASTITNVGASVITGNLGLYPGTSVTGFPPGIITGRRDVTNTSAHAAQTAALAAYIDLQGRTPATTQGPGNIDIGGTSVAPGVHAYTSSLAITGTVTLNGTSSSVWIFQVGSTLTANAGSVVLLTGGALAKNVFWQVGSSATLDATSTFAGTVIAQASVSLAGAAGTNVAGQLMALTGAVTISNADNVNATGAAPGGAGFRSAVAQAGTISIKYGTPILISTLSRPDGRSPAVLPSYPQPDLDNYLLAFLFSPATPWPSIPWTAPGAGAPGPMLNSTTTVTNADIDNDVLSTEFGGRNGDIGE
jgi:hypothetical protein